MPVYQGRNSCMAKREGVFVRRVGRPGIDTVREAIALAYMVLRDYRRGYTYDPDNNCRKIRMTHELFEKRLRYIHTLSIRHGATAEEQDAIKRLVNYVYKHRKMPKTLTVGGKRLDVKSAIKKMVVKT